MSESVEKLMQTMEEDLRNQRDLAAVLENKLDAMRHFDMSRLDALALSEQRLMSLISVQERRRQLAIRQVSNELIPAAGKPEDRLLKNTQRRPVSAKELATAMKEPAGRKLMALAGMLREMAEKVQRLNRVNSLASRKILGHFDQIFRIIAQSGSDIGLYGNEGKKFLLEQNRLVDALA